MTHLTLEQHMATLRAQDSTLTGEDVLTPFDGYEDGEPCQVTAVLQRVAVVCAPDSEKRVVNLRLVTVDPANVHIKDPSARRALVIAAARGRYASRNNMFGRAGKGVRDGG